MTTDQLIPKTRDELLMHSAAKGRLTFVVGPLCYGKARAGHTAYGIARAPEASAVNLTAGTVTAPDGTPARVLGSF